MKLTAAQRVDALEEAFANLLLVLEAEPEFTVEKFIDWLLLVREAGARHGRPMSKSIALGLLAERLSMHADLPPPGEAEVTAARKAILQARRPRPGSTPGP
ncbi:MAG: hypothetical protein AB7I35_12160 [Ramlibacter sp.]